MRRRDFLKALIGSTTALPFAATAQQSIPLIGYLHVGSPEPYALMVAAFREGLKEVGFVDGQNVHIEYRWAEGRVDRLPALAEELVSRRVAVLATGGGERSALVAKQATQIIPVVFVTGSNPIEAHLVESLNRPGGNVTGISFFTIELGPKRVGLLRDLIPNAHTIAVLSDSSNAGGGSAEGLAEVQKAARGVGYETSVVRASNAREIDEAFSAIGQQKTDALWRNAAAARLRRGAPSFIPALHPLDDRTHTHAKMLGRFMPRCACFNHVDNALTQVTGVRLWHRYPPRSRINAETIIHS
jgi:putative ABC transport system substrate-binding protein